MYFGWRIFYKQKHRYYYYYCIITMYVAKVYDLSSNKSQKIIFPKVEVLA